MINNSSKEAKTKESWVDAITIWLKRYKVEVVIFILGLIFINLIFILETFREANTINGASAGQLGDFVGGYIGTILTLLSVLLFYSTLTHQLDQRSRNIKPQAFAYKKEQ